MQNTLFNKTNQHLKDAFSEEWNYPNYGSITLFIMSAELQPAETRDTEPLGHWPLQTE